MKPFVVYTALALAIIFLAGALLAGVEVLQEEHLLTNPKLKPALGSCNQACSSASVCAVGARDNGKPYPVIRRPPVGGPVRFFPRRQLFFHAGAQEKSRIDHRFSLPNRSISFLCPHRSSCRR
jgi:hypothetical protein